jgi:pimeloyl-ACP methyl ester carboxylesterase
MAYREELLAALPVREQRLEICGVSTAVLEGGEGAPLVLLHGPGGYAAHWMGVIPGLARRWRVIAPDLPGHGASPIGDGALDAARVLAWLEELIRRTCESPPRLVGHLAGGAIAARLALEHPHRTSGLALVNTFGLAPLQLPAEFAQALSQFLSRPDELSHEALWRHCAFDLDALRARMGARWQPFAAYNLERARDPAVQAAVSALMREFTTQVDLAHLPVPTTLIWGRHDRANPLAMAEAAARRYGWPLHVIENANDDPPIEQPEAVVRALLGALERTQAVPVGL